MKREHLHILAEANLRAANDMVTALAAGIYAGGAVNMSSQVVGNLALDTAEYILSRISSDKDNMELGDDE